MFLTTGHSFYTVPLSGTYIKTKKGLLIENPSITFKLLSFSDLAKLEIMIQSGIDISEVYLEICNKSITGVIHLEGDNIDFMASPAGVLDHLGSKILHHSKGVLDDLPTTFSAMLNRVTLLDQIEAVVCRYTNTPMVEIKCLPLDELIKKYSVLHASFPNEVMPIVIEEDEVSKVGG